MAKRIRPLRVGRGVRWTFEVSADVDPKSDARATRTARKRPPAKSTVKRAKPAVRRRAQPIAKSASAPVTSSVEPTGPVPIAQVAAAPMVTAPPIIAPPTIAPPMIPQAVFAPASDAAAVSASPAAAAHTTRLQWIVLVAAAVLVVAAVAYPRGPAAPDVPAGDGSLATASPAGPSARSAQAIAVDTVPAAGVNAAQAAAMVAPQPVSEAPKKPVVPAVTKRAAAAKSPAPIVAAPVEPPKKEEPVAVAAAVEPPPAPVSASTAIVTPGLVTITGCLEISTDGDTFRLTDAEGADVPKSRSWRSGFFKKRPAPVMLVDPPAHLGLKTSVGKRVSATGQLREPRPPHQLAARRRSLLQLASNSSSVEGPWGCQSHENETTLPIRLFAVGIRPVRERVGDGFSRR